MAKYYLDFLLSISRETKRMHSVSDLLSAVDIKQMQLLLEQGVSIKEQDILQNPNLYYIIYYKLREISLSGHPTREKVMQELLQAVDSNIQNKDKETYLHHAVCNGDLTIVAFLLKNGARSDALDQEEETPLHKAAHYGHLEIAKLLLKEDAKPNVGNKLGDTTLHQAAYYGQTAIAQLLLEHGAEIDLLNTREETPLHQAARQGHLDVATLLLRRGSKVEAVDKNRETPLHQAVHVGRHTTNLGHQKVVILLLEQGAMIDCQNNAGSTPLHDAAYKADLAMIKLLLAQGANPVIKDTNKETALGTAKRQDHNAQVLYNAYKAHHYVNNNYADLNPDKDAVRREESIKHRATIELLSKEESDFYTKNESASTSLVSLAKGKWKEAKQSSFRLGQH